MNCKLFLVASFLFSILTGCNDSESGRSTGTYFGGHIVNPTAGYLTLIKDTTVIDTSYLDKEDNFSFRLKNTEEGLYSFQHGYESQIMYLAPGDSILMWANTLEFEESLHFSGIGAEKNNFLVNLFLQNENNTDLVLDYYKIPPAEFQEITDSIRTRRLNRLAELEEKHDFSQNFVEVARKMVQFENNNLKEQYTYLINKYYPEFSEDFPANFFDYRKDINFSEKTFQSNPAYLRFLENYLINLSMQDCTGNPENNDCFDTNDYENIRKRIELIDSLTVLPMVRNYIFNKLGSAGMVMGKNRHELKEILELLDEKGIPNQDFRNLLTLGSIQLAFIPGINVGNTPLVTPEGEHIRISNIIDKRAIIYIWSMHSPAHHKSQHRSIEDLKIKYPDIDFIGINIDIGETSSWRNALLKYGYDLENEYQLDNIKIQGREVGSDVFKSYLNKLLFLDAEGTVVIGDAYINSPDFESRILEFLNL